MTKSNIKSNQRVSREFLETNYPDLQLIYDAAIEDILGFKDKNLKMGPAYLLTFEVLTNEPFCIQRTNRMKERITYEDFMHKLITNDRYYLCGERNLTLIYYET